MLPCGVLPPSPQTPSREEVREQLTDHAKPGLTPQFPFCQYKFHSYHLISHVKEQSSST